MGIAQRQDYDKKDAGPFIAKNRIAIFMASIQLLLWPGLLFIINAICRNCMYGDFEISRKSKIFGYISTIIWGIYQFCRVYKKYKQKINE